jgi:hypothetical protein
MYAKEQLDEALTLLGNKLELGHAETACLVVCGGSSLIITGLVDRTTKDVDVVAVGYPQGNEQCFFQPSGRLSDPIRSAAIEVAHDLGLHENWLNTGPSDLMKTGLPAGFLDRCHVCHYGNALTVYFLNRFDQIHLKVYAAVDSGPGRHVNDLLALNPSEKEMESAARWAMTHDTSENFRLILKDMLAKLGYENVSQKI